MTPLPQDPASGWSLDPAYGWSLDPAVARLLDGALTDDPAAPGLRLDRLPADPFAVLGPTPDGHGLVVHVPGAQRVQAVNDDTAQDLTRVSPGADVFAGPLVPYYRLRIEWPAGVVEEREDPYRFGPVLGEIDEHLIGEGSHRRLWEALGAHLTTHESVAGLHVAVWAPHARRAALVGGFNSWNPTAHPLRPRGATGVWELFVPGLGEGTVYKYALTGPDGERLPLKADPVGFGAELPPATGSVVRPLGQHRWTTASAAARQADGQPADAQAAGRNAADQPMSIYEVHLGSWRRADGGRPLSYVELGEELVDYVADLGFTHLEVMPVSEHPFAGSWGYQPVGLFAPTSRHGTPREFAQFVDRAHARGLGVLADWVPGHFPTDAHGLGRFDGTALYEHRDPREGHHPDWQTLIYNYGRPEVRNLLVSNALYWLE